MDDTYIIINEAKTTWTPPIYGNYIMTVEDITYQPNKSYNESNEIVNICLREVNSTTFINQARHSALYSIIKGEKKLFSSSIPKQSHVTIRQPITFYFSNEIGGVIESDTPIVKVNIRFINRIHD